MNVCPSGYFKRFVDGKPVCDYVCPEGTYANPMTGECESCDSVCLTCSTGRSICDPPCPNGLVWYKSTCVPVCPYGYFVYGYYDMS